MEQSYESREVISDYEVMRQLATIEYFFRSQREKLIQLTGNIEFLDKNDGSPVTSIDIQIEKELQELFKAEYPEVPVYGEETECYSDEASLFWLIDPIDGTKSFIEGLPVFSNMAALIDQGVTRAAIIYNPTRDDAYTAVRGWGAKKNGQSISLSEKNPPHILLIKSELFQPIRTILTDVDITLVNPPSGGGDGFTQILDGRVAARFQMHASGSAHDYAPGALLVEEAGGVILPIKNQFYSFESNSFIAAHTCVADLLNTHLGEIREYEN